MNKEKETHKRYVRYFEKHHILHLFQQMTAAIIYFQPEDPHDYIIKYIKTLLEASKNNTSWISADISPLESIEGRKSNNILEQLTVENVD